MTRSFQPVTLRKLSRRCTPRRVLAAALSTRYITIGRYWRSFLHDFFTKAWNLGKVFRFECPRHSWKDGPLPSESPYHTDLKVLTLMLFARVGQLVASKDNTRLVVVRSEVVDVALRGRFSCAQPAEQLTFHFILQSFCKAHAQIVESILLSAREACEQEQVVTWYDCACFGGLFSLSDQEVFSDIAQNLKFGFLNLWARFPSQQMTSNSHLPSHCEICCALLVHIWSYLNISWVYFEYFWMIIDRW